MPHLPSAFSRLLEPIDRRVLRRVVAAHEGDKGVGGGWTCARHLKALLFAQFAGLKSLREIEQALAARPAALYHLNLRAPRRSTLSDAARQRPADVFRDLAGHLMAGMARGPRVEGADLIRLIDASPIPLKDARFDWAEAVSRSRGLKLHLVYDPNETRPVRFAVTSPKRSDIDFARDDMPLEADATYVFDKGYIDYGWWQDIHKAGALFVTRLKSNTKRRDVQPLPVPPGPANVIADAILKIGHKKPRGGAVNRLHDTPVREVTVARDGKPPLHLVTNDFRRTAAEIADLYKQRWDIELFFKWIKQTLKIKTFLGRSENAVKTQIYVALIAFILLRLLKNADARCLKGGLKTLLDRLKVALLDPIDLTNRAKQPPKPPAKRPPPPQFSLKLA